MTTVDNEAVQTSPVEGARRIADQIVAGAQDGERLGRLPDASANALLDQRLCNVLVPRSWGGWGGGHCDVFEVVEEVSRADASAGWCVGIGTSNNTGMADGLPVEGLEEVFGSCNGRVIAAGALVPVAISEPADGGFRVSGRFAWASGSAHSDWYVVGSLLTVSSGLAIRMHVVPMAECEAFDTWNVSGLKATGSRDLKVDNVFVPAHRCYTMELQGATFAETYAHSSGATAAVESGTTDRRRGSSIADTTVFGVSAHAAWSLGVARRAVEEFVVTAPTSKRILAEGMLADDSAVQVGLARVDGPLRAARSQLVSLLADVDLAVGGLPEELRVDVMESALTATRAAREAVLYVFDVAPASSIQLSNPIQRCLRDLLTGLKHAASSPTMFAKVAQARLGSTEHGL